MKHQQVGTKQSLASQKPDAIDGASDKRSDQQPEFARGSLFAAAHGGIGTIRPDTQKPSDQAAIVVIEFKALHGLDAVDIDQHFLAVDCGWPEKKQPCRPLTFVR